MAKQSEQQRKQVAEVGFTLVELVVTLTVGIILLALAVPSLQNLIQNNRISAATNDLFTAINLARSAAIKRGTRVTICKSGVDNVCADANGWQQGWIVFADPDSNAVYTAESEDLLRVREPIGGNVVITGNANVEDYISYVARGNSELVSGFPQNGTITVCDHRSGDFGRNLVLSRSGRIRVERGMTCP